MSNNYETLYILRPDLGEEVVQQQVERYRTLITEHSATDIQVKVWGKKRLAYPIKKLNDGVYVQMNYQASGFGGLPSNHPRLNMPFTDACKAYNVGKCSKQAGTCTTKKGTPLRHTCNWSDLSVHNAVVCGQPHPAYLNH